jgi:iron complex outermembrane receptor protein
MALLDNLGKRHKNKGRDTVETSSSGKLRLAPSGASWLAIALTTPGLAWAQTLGTPATPEQVSPEQVSPEQVSEVVVTGSSIRGVPPTGSNLISVSREDIRAVGANTTPELLASVPQLNSFNTAPRRSMARTLSPAW